MALPDNIEYATVKGRFILAVADSADEDEEPDAVPAQGQVHFTPNVKSLLNATADPPTVIIPRRVTIDLDAEGYLSLNGSRTIKLLATDNEALNPSDWTYQVTYALQGVDIPSVNIQLEAGTTVDITGLVPVSPSTGTPTLVGPPGPPGPPGDGSGGVVVTKVNSITPDGSGNVTLDYTDVGAAAASHNHAASEISTGVLDAARIPTLSQSKVSNLSTDLAGKAAVTHTHAAGDINSGTISIARLPVAADGVSSSTALVRADDSRLSSIGGGGEGTVTSVNNIEPDGSGNITLTAADVGASATGHAHAAGDISSGTLHVDRIPTLAQSKITNLTTDLAAKAPATHSHGAAEITAGTFDEARIPTLAQSKVTGLETALAARPTSSTITEIWTGTQAAYDAITTKVATTLYIVTED